MTNTKTKRIQRTIATMTPAAQAKARRLWEIIQGPEYDTGHWEACRDQYYAMFKEDKNFTVEG